ncbi:MAG TPA: hypothetical protein VK420_20095 [Longimicrobium sp.]|nr:hypothetical protein [Longimicrobium sp.]
MAGKFSRFLHLEGPRQGRKDEGEDAPRADGRFEALEHAPGPRADPGALPSAHPRFAPPPEPRAKEATGAKDGPVELAGRLPAELSFIRCVRCESDNHGFAESCRGCDASFDTPEQREFNARMQEWVREHAEQSAQQDAAKHARIAAEVESVRAVRHPLDPEPDIPEKLLPYWPRYERVGGGAQRDGELIPVDRVAARIGAFVVPLLAIPIVLKLLAVELHWGRRRSFPLSILVGLFAFALTRSLWRYSHGRD